MSAIPIETERKFLIYMPCLDTLCAQPEIRIQEITQTYLLTDGKKNARIRKINECGNISYIKTVKERISTLSCYEEEKEINEEQYLELLKYADKEKQSINKTYNCNTTSNKKIRFHSITYHNKFYHSFIIKSI